MMISTVQIKQRGSEIWFAYFWHAHKFPLLLQHNIYTDHFILMKINTFHWWPLKELSLPDSLNAPLIYYTLSAKQWSFLRCLWKATVLPSSVHKDPTDVSNAEMQNLHNQLICCILQQGTYSANSHPHQKAALVKRKLPHCNSRDMKNISWVAAK